MSIDYDDLVTQRAQLQEHLYACTQRIEAQLARLGECIALSTSVGMASQSISLAGSSGQPDSETLEAARDALETAKKAVAALSLTVEAMTKAAGDGA